jgi:hypothetical protein
MDRVSFNAENETFHNKEIGINEQEKIEISGKNQRLLILKTTMENRSGIVEHKAAIESSAETLHHETISEFCYHLYSKWCAS